MDELRIERIRDDGDPQAAKLFAASDAYLEALYPPESNHAETLGALLDGDGAFFVGYLGDRAVACGGARVFDGGEYGEIKRVFVDEACRGRNAATAIIRRIERYLREEGVSTVRLEAGPKQPAALALYLKLGYEFRGPFGNYADDPLSVFMEKRLAPTDTGYAAPLPD